MSGSSGLLDLNSVHRNQSNWGYDWGYSKNRCARKRLNSLNIEVIRGSPHPLQLPLQKSLSLVYKTRRNLGLLCPRLSRFDHLFPAASVPCGGLSREWSVPGISRSPHHRGLLRKKALDHGTYRHCDSKRKAPGEAIQDGR
jgi:hypothetical protein